MQSKIEPNVYDTATFLKGLSESHCNPEIKKVLFEAAVLLCKQRDEIQEMEHDRTLKVEAVKEGDYWYWQGDGEDHLQSFCSGAIIVITAEELRAIVKPEFNTSEINNIGMSNIFAGSAFDEAMKIV